MKQNETNKATSLGDKLTAAEEKKKTELKGETKKSLLEQMVELEEQTEDIQGLDSAEQEAIRRLIKKSAVTKVQLAEKLGVKVNTLAYKIKFGTLSRNEAETIVEAIQKSLTR